MTSFYQVECKIKLHFSNRKNTWPRLWFQVFCVTRGLEVWGQPNNWQICVVYLKQYLVFFTLQGIWDADANTFPFDPELFWKAKRCHKVIKTTILFSEIKQNDKANYIIGRFKFNKILELSSLVYVDLKARLKKSIFNP